QVLRAGGVVLYPTDTLYGLGADAFSDEAVAKVYEIKGREEKKPIHCIVADVEMAERYGKFNDTARILAKEFWPGSLTIVVEKKSGVKSGIGHRIKTIGIRIPKNDFCLALAKEFGKPYTTTSANVSSAASKRSVDNILAQIGKMTSQIELVIDAGELPQSEPSTIVDVSGTKPIILREGAIAASEIWNVLGAEPRSESA
ncbi:threonylcarbamoyl-AMP synthase, partial [Candidatus Kaiserbacteria bacterium RIFCSPLOWO2_01_FULL_54_13]